MVMKIMEMQMETGTLVMDPMGTETVITIMAVTMVTEMETGMETVISE